MHLTVLAALVPQIREQIVDVIKVIPEEWMSKQIVQQIVDVPASKILVEIVERVAYRRQATARVDVHFPVPQIQEKIVEVIKVILREQCQRVRFFSFHSMWRGAVGCTRRACAAPQSTSTRGCWRMLTACGKLSCGLHAKSVVPHSLLPKARFDSECNRWNPEHVVIDPFSYITPSALLLPLSSSVG